MVTNDELIHVVDVIKEYNHGEVKALNGCSLTVHKGEVWAIGLRQEHTASLPEYARNPNLRSYLF